MEVYCMKMSKIPLLFFLSLHIYLSGCGGNNSPASQGVTGLESDRLPKSGIEHVIHISVDGLQSLAISTLGESNLPGLYYIRRNGSFTDNARTDDRFTTTLPNHISQFTSRPVSGLDGHNFNINTNALNVTIHTNKKSYVTSVFDMVHDYGLSTALYTSKTKFELFKSSWGPEFGAFDRVLPDSGQNKIDSYVKNVSTDLLTDLFIQDLTNNKYNYAFLHLKDPDSKGHEFGWSLTENSEYLKSVEKVDVNISKVIGFINSNTDFQNTTILIVTADHGGQFDTLSHAFYRTNNEFEAGVIPFYIYGVTIPAGMDLYSWNPGLTQDPGITHPLFSDASQPIRNGDVGNLCMELLGLPNIPGATIDSLSYPW